MRISALGGLFLTISFVLSACSGHQSNVLPSRLKGDQLRNIGHAAIGGSTPLWGISLDCGFIPNNKNQDGFPGLSKLNANLPSILDRISHLAKKPTVRVVFDEGAQPSDYVPALQKLHSVAYIMGTVLDSSHLHDFNPATYRARAQNYYDTLASYVDIWEIGNEINGDWTSDSDTDAGRKMVGDEITAAFDEAKSRGLTTAVTIEKHDGEETKWEAFRFIKDHLPSRVTNGVDYALLSYYEDPAAINWSTYFTKLASTFPNSKVGFGEMGGSYDNTGSAEHQDRLNTIAQLYGLTLPSVPSYIGGYFYWYFCSDEASRGGDIWVAINDKISNGAGGDSPPPSTPTPSVVGGNIILPTSANDGGDDGTNVSSNVIDGDFTTRWSSEGAGSNITVDMGSPILLSGTQIAWYKGDQRQNTFTVTASTDGRVFSPVYAGTSSGSRTGFEEYDFSNAINARYLRITFQSNSQNDWASISEIRGVGASSRGTPPPPSPPPGSGSTVVTPVGATADGDDGTNVASNAIDGDFSTRWSEEGTGSNITVDLGSVQSVTAAQVAWYKGDSRANSFGIATSTDGATFNQVFSGSSTGSSTALETYTFVATNAQFLKVTFQSNTANDWASISEIRGVTGSGSASPTPSPTSSPSSGISLTGWNVTLPVDSSGNDYCNSSSPGHAVQLQPAAFTPPYLVRASNGGLDFFAPACGTPTGNSGYGRTELVDTNVFNTGTSGSHTLAATLTINQVPANGKMVIGQIHGQGSLSADPYALVYYENGAVYAKVNQQLASGGSYNRYDLLSGVPIGSAFSYVIHDLGTGQLNFTVKFNGQTQSKNALIPSTWSGQTTRFQVGAYNQDSNYSSDTDGGRINFASLSRN